MTNYADRSKQMKKLLIEKMSELSDLFHDTKQGKSAEDMSYVAYLKTNYIIEISKYLNREISDSFNLEDDKNAYETNFILAGSLYFEDFAALFTAWQDPTLLKELIPDEEKRQQLVGSLKVIEEELLNGLLLGKDPIANEVLKARIAASEKNLIEQSRSRDTKDLYAIGFNNTMALYQTYIINMANAYALKNKDEDPDYVERLMDLIEEKTFKFNYFLWSTCPYDGADMPKEAREEITASYYNRVLDEFVDLAGFSELLGDISGLAKSENLVLGFEEKLRKTIVARDMKSYNGHFKTTNRAKYTINNYGNQQDYVIASTSHPQESVFWFHGHNDVSFILGKGEETIKFKTPNTHIYTYPYPMEKQIDVVRYSPSQDAGTVPLETYVYENKRSTPYVVYLSQIPALQFDPSSAYICLTPDEETEIISSKPQISRELLEVRLELPARARSVLIAETDYPKLSDLANPKERSFKRVLHFVNKRYMDTVVFGEGK